jgi:hypothetical protein
MLRSLLIATVLASTLGISACNSGNKEQQPTAEEQKRIQEENRKAIEQQKQLTSGYGNSMNHVAPNAGYAPEKTKKQQQAHHTKPTQQQQQQPSDQPQQ